MSASPTVDCPNGHRSTDPEWCDTCGARIGGSPSPDPDPDPVPVSVGDSTVAGATSAATSAACPHCGAVNLPDVLFCEACGYDFTTGQTPVPAVAVAVDTPPLPVSSTDPPPGGTPGWIVIVEVDAEWYRLKGSLADQPCPPPSSSTVPLSDHTALIGRTSASRGIRPEIALDSDTGVSRRHAQFVLEPDLVTVVDLSSTNGTYVVAAGAEPDEALQPIVPGVPSVLADGDRVYVGAWTRLTVRSV